MGQLKKDSSVPLYQQLVNEIKDQISNGSLKASGRIMTEQELSKEYDISRITVRKAIELLVEEEILIKKQGIGTFVAEKKINRDMSTCMGFTRSCELEGRKASSRLITADLIPATVSDINSLELKEGERVIRIIRIRYCDEMPVIVEENHFSQKFAFLLGCDLTGSLHQLLTENNSAPVRGKKKIGICHANEMEKEYLQVAEGEALLLTRDIGYDRENIPIYCSKSVINPDRYTLSIDMNG